MLRAWGGPEGRTASKKLTAQYILPDIQLAESATQPLSRGIVFRKLLISDIRVLNIR